MRAYIVAAGLALSAIGAASGTVVDTGADAQKYCRALVEGSFRDSDDARSAGTCEGMIETVTVFAPDLPAELRACPPAQGSALASAKVLLQYLDRNPDRLSEAGITLAIEALRDSWPCENDDPTATAGPTPKPKKHAAKKPKQ
jgi:hypothetical protein